MGVEKDDNNQKKKKYPGHSEENKGWRRWEQL